MSQLHQTAILVMLVMQIAPAMSHEDTSDLPSVMIVMLARNKAPYLPYTLTQLSRLDYPKERLSLWIASEDNQDRTAAMLHAWLERHGPLYADVEAVVNSSSPPQRTDERSGAHMSAGRRRAVADVKQAALQSARRRGVEFVWFLDADVILYDHDVLRQLLNMRKPIVAPMLSSSGSYYNIQFDIDRNFCPEEGGDITEIFSRKKLGCFAVPLIRSCVLVDLRNPRTAGLTFVPESSETQPDLLSDDAVFLAVSARRSGLKMIACNQEDYGLVPVPLTETQDLGDEWRNLVSIKLKALMNHPPLTVLPLMRLFLPPPALKSSLRFDKFYVIGLERRPERWRRIKACLDELGIAATRVLAVDGRKLTNSFLEERNIRPRGEGREISINMGEVGCFLSHYGVWKDMLDKGYERVVVLEDDSHPTIEFPERLQQLMDEVDRLRLEWDFLYLHRDPIRKDEPVQGSDRLVRPGFSYSSMAYVLSRSGAEILLRDRPLENLLCVDHYLPLMAGNAPYSEWMKKYPSAGTLKQFALGTENLIEPVKRPGEAGFISDNTVVDGELGAASCGDGDEDCFMPAF